MIRRWKWLVAAGIAGGVVFAAGWWLQQPDGDRATDRSMQEMADDLSYPQRQSSAAGLLNAVLDRTGRGGAITVVRAEDRDQDGWMAELVVHLHQDAYDSEAMGFSWDRHHEASDSCYRLKFTNYQGFSWRIHCPSDLTPLPRSKTAEPPRPVVTCRSGEGGCPGG